MNERHDDGLSEPREPEAPVSPETPAAPEAWVPAAAPPVESTAKTSSTRRRAGIIGIILALLAIPGAKFVLPLIVGQTALAVIGAAMGGPYAKLPADVRAGFEQRFERVAPTGFTGMSEQEQADWIKDALSDGMPRLGDDLLVRRLSLQTLALEKADTSTCAAFALEDPVTDETSTKLVGYLDGDDLEDWFDIAISAIEAHAAGTAAPEAPSDAEFEPVFGAVFAGMAAADQEAVVALAEGNADEATACQAWLAVYRAIETLEPATRAMAARYDVLP